MYCNSTLVYACIVEGNAIRSFLTELQLIDLPEDQHDEQIDIYLKGNYAFPNRLLCYSYHVLAFPPFL